MAILKNEIPIPECDSDADALLRPDQEHRDLRLPERAVLAFAGDAVRRL